MALIQKNSARLEFDSVALLQAESKPSFVDGQIVYIKGITASNDDGHGNFRYDSSSSATDDGATIINPIGIGNGRFLRIFGKTVSVKDFGATGNGSTNDTVAVQAAVTHCIANNLDLEVSGLCLLTASVNVDRQVDGAAFDNYFTISSNSGGGFLTKTAIALFSSSIAFTTAPVTQLVKFQDIRFETDNSALTAYVLDDARFLRTVFAGCSFRKIKCLEALTVHIQSIYFIGCQARRWTGDFFKSKATTFDLKVTNMLMEAGGDGFDLDFPVGSSFIGSTIEGMTNYAIKYIGGYAFNVTDCYFEGNGIGVSGGLSIDGSAGTGSDASEAVTISGNYFSGDTTDFTKAQVLWGDAVASSSSNNLCTTVLHTFLTNSRVSVVNDYARMALSTNAQKDITAITKANPAVVTAAAHGYVNGDTAAIVGVVGMTEVNDLPFTIANVTTNTFELSGINSTAYTTYTSGGKAYSQVNSVRNESYVGQTYRAASQFNYGGIVRSSFVGGDGGYLRLRSLQGGVESVNGLDVDHLGNVRVADVLYTPSVTYQPASNGEMTFEAISNTSIKINYKGSDGTVRSVSLTLA